MLVPRENKPDLAHKGAVCDYLNAANVNYTIVESVPNVTQTSGSYVGVAANVVIRVEILQDEKGLLMVILPEDCLFDIGMLCKQINRDLDPAKYDLIGQFFGNCEQGAFPPVPDLFDIPAIMDEALEDAEQIYFKPGVNDAFVCMSRRDFMKFHVQTWRDHFSIPVKDLSDVTHPEGGASAQVKQLTPLRIKKRVEQTMHLPAIPVIASQILRLRFDPKATVADLANLIEKDPSLAAQLMNWAQSPYYGYSGKITSVEAAIVKVLGFDVVMNLALGIALGKAMRLPLEGPLGLREYWAFSVYCAALVELLQKAMPMNKRPQKGLAYLAGLLHNFGHLLLSQVFPPYFQLLNRYISVNPHINLLDIEHYVLGVGHDEMGEWLVKAWNLPPEVIVAVRWHHQADYNSEHSAYANLVFIAIALLKRHHIGDASTTELPEDMLARLGITEQQAEDALSFVMSQREDLALLANQLIGG